MTTDHIILSEHIATVPGMIGLVTIGQKLGSTRFGMALPPNRPMSDMPAYVNDAGNETDTGGKPATDWWANYNGRLIAAQVAAQGWAAVDLSGHCFGREIMDTCGIYEKPDGEGGTYRVANPGDADGWPYTIEAIRRTIAASKCEPDSRWVFWPNSEAGNPKPTLEFFRRLWSSGITRDAALIVTNMVGGYEPKRHFIYNPRAIDGRSSEVPCWLDSPWAPTPFEAANQSVAWFTDCQNAGLTPWAHMCSFGYDGHGNRVDAEMLSAQSYLIGRLRDCGCKRWLIFNYAGRVPGKEDVLTQQSADAATVAAIFGR